MAKYYSAGFQSDLNLFDYITTVGLGTKAVDRLTVVLHNLTFSKCSHLVFLMIYLQAIVKIKRSVLTPLSQWTDNTITSSSLILINNTGTKLLQYVN